MTKKEKLIYLAGILDGEGCISLLPMPRNKKVYYPVILVTNTNEKLLSWLKNNFDGDYRFVVDKKFPWWKKRGTWRLSNKKAINLLDSLYPYLMLKRDQALVAICLSVAKEVARTEGGFKDKRYNNGWLEAFAYLKGEITKLNKKGYAI